MDQAELRSLRNRLQMCRGDPHQHLVHRRTHRQGQSDSRWCTYKGVVVVMVAALAAPVVAAPVVAAVTVAVVAR
jgi:hypothetical protein